MVFLVIDEAKPPSYRRSNLKILYDGNPPKNEKGPNYLASELEPQEQLQWAD